MPACRGVLCKLLGTRPQPQFFFLATLLFLGYRGVSCPFRTFLWVPATESWKRLAPDPPASLTPRQVDWAGKSWESWAANTHLVLPGYVLLPPNLPAPLQESSEGPLLRMQ